MIKIKLFIPVHCVSLFVLLCCGRAVYSNPIDQHREYAVQLIQKGEVDHGLLDLKKLLVLYPKDQKLIADYFVLSYGRNTLHATELITCIENIQIEVFPIYAQTSVVKTLRDARQYSLAKKMITEFRAHNPQMGWNVWLATIAAETKQNQEAQSILKQVDMQQLNAEELVLLSHTYRLVGMPIQALQAANAAFDKKKNQFSQEEYLLALNDNGNYKVADEYIMRSVLFQTHPDLVIRIKLSQFATQIKNAVLAYKTAQQESKYADAYVELDQVLAEMESYKPIVNGYPHWQKSFYADYIYALAKRKRYTDILTTLQSISIPLDLWPTYTRHAIADAYFATNQPEQAEQVYLSLFNEKNYADYDVYSALYYAYLEQEKFEEANNLIDEMEHQLRRYQYSQVKGVDRTTHEDWEQYLSLKGLNLAYRNELEKAEQYFENLVSIAPRNIGYQNNLALIQCWRQKTLTAKLTLEQWNGLDEVSQMTEINQMNNAQALGNISYWRELNKKLLQTAAEDTGVQLSYKELKDRDRWSIEHHSSFSRNKSNDDRLLNSLRGSNAQSFWTRLNSPWFNDYYRIFVEHQYRKARYKNKKLDDARVGLGLEWSSNRKTANILLSERKDQERLGVRLDWSHWLNDHWAYNFSVDSDADIPLQAIAQKHKGQSYVAAMNWQANESRKAGIQYQAIDIDDGNLRQAYQAYFSQQFFQSPQHTSTATVTGYYGRNKAVQVDYFNPVSSHSIELNLQHDWLTWREYERDFKQHFELTLGTFKQKDFAHQPVYNFLYRHDWRISRVWYLNYGVGWGSHPYDGEHEDKTYAILGFEGRF